MDVAEYKEAQRRTWAMGDYVPVGRLIEPGARALIASAEPLTGRRLLDVGVGSGNVAVAAAVSGADVSGIDITDAWFGAARDQADAADVSIDLRIGDVEEIPFDDATFDVVLSSFAAIFAPDHRRAASELVRVCRPGGMVGLTAWTPDGNNNLLLGALMRHLPDLPDFVEPYISWGDPTHVRRNFAGTGLELRFSQPSFRVSFPSLEAFEIFSIENSGGMSAARRALEAAGRWKQARRDMYEAMDATNEAADGSYTTTWDFLLIEGRKRIGG